VTCLTWASVHSIAKHLNDAITEALLSAREDGCIYINFRYCNPSWQLHLNNNRPQVLLGWDMHGAKVHEYVPRLVAWLSQGLPPEFDHQCASHVVHHTCQHPACCNFEHLQWMALADHAQQHAGKKRKTGHR